MKVVHILGAPLLSVATLFGLLQSASGQEWIKSAAPATNWMTVASSADGANLAAAAGFGQVYTSADAGVTWAPTTAPLSGWNSIASSADGRSLAAVTGPGGLYISTDAGATWMPSTLPHPADVSVAISADASMLIVASQGGVLSSSDFGATWTNSQVASGNYVILVACSADGSKLLAEAQGPYSPVYVSTNSGASWFATGATNDFPGGVAISADGTTMVAASYTFDIGGPIYVSTNSGLTWTTASVPYDYWESVTCSADGRIMAAFGGAGVYISTNSGTAWNNSGARTGWVSKLASSADGCRLVLASQDKAIYTRTVSPAPVLSLSPSGNNLLISWIIPSMPFSLQETDTLATPNWADVTNAPVLNYSTLRNEVAIPAANGARFYRLKAQ